MTASLSSELRARRLVSLALPAPVTEGGIATRLARLSHTAVAWSECPDGGGTLHQEFEHETIVVLPDAAAVLTADGGRAEAPARSTCVLPAGPCTIAVTGRGTVIRFLSPVPDALDVLTGNHDDYLEPRAKLRPLGAPFARIGPRGPRVHPIARLAGADAGKPRCVQSATMSVMWMDQPGPHDRRRLYPHAHADFEEGSLVIAGRYVLHLRTPWGTDADAWRDDDHFACTRGSLVIIPAEVTHSAEAIGEGDHLLLNFFAPPRRDHMEKGQVVNVAEYRLDLNEV